ncbi:hypothetical protein J2T57_001457 [Natronocella acetinitrilica]|uniref:Uncharacterized protein n=1 Tax=Natronocella acetinitrilica TaxID=414046 RepID=A0AAE3G278_9GAMM|nr:hypothetical protein [Natronocella acetinitrilica]MCP1674355.1 hypothetical protein [Natronocella acetinitrilica]
MLITAYHGTPYRFSRFRAAASGIHFGSVEQAVHACTIRLGKLPIAQFERLTAGRVGWPGRILQVRLSIRCMERVADAGTAAAWQAAIREARAAGIDALVYENAYEGRLAGDAVVVFEPTAIEILDPDWNPASRHDEQIMIHQ